MEENNLNQNLAEEKKPEKKNLTARVWLMSLTIFYGISLFSAFYIISKKQIKPKPIIDGEAEESVLSALSQKESVAIIPIYGAIYQDSSSSFIEKGSQMISSRIKKTAENKKIKAIVLDINSPGGSVGAVQEIYSTIKKVKSETNKPFVARFGEVSASGGYYVASACDMIIAHPGTITGSIGVIFSAGNIEGLFKKIGVKSEVIKSGKFKDIGSISREMTKEERDILQSMINDSYDSFLTAVSEGRKIEKDKLKDIADGRVFTGTQAVKSGLVDKLGDLQDAIDEAGVLSGLGKNPKVIKSRRAAFDEVFDILGAKISLFNINEVKPSLLEYRWAGF